MIRFFILVTRMCDLGVIFLGEIRSHSRLGVKRLAALRIEQYFYKNRLKFLLQFTFLAQFSFHASRT